MCTWKSNDRNHYDGLINNHEQVTWVLDRSEWPVAGQHLHVDVRRVVRDDVHALDDPTPDTKPRAQGLRCHDTAGGRLLVERYALWPQETLHMPVCRRQWVLNCVNLWWSVIVLFMIDLIQGGHSPGKQGNQGKVWEKYFDEKVREKSRKFMKKVREKWNCFARCRIKC